MQVNVKELSGVLHLELLFINVLVLKSFLAVCQVCQISQVFQAVPAKCNLKYSSHSKCVRTPF